ncbi:MAG: heme A synthase [Chloroflexi bacterium]|nr:heme A synthase [Chloroflexota bacterium]
MSEPSSMQTSKAFRTVAVATIIMTYLLVVVGGIVRVTGSGLGCPDWPLCEGRIIPTLEGATLIEFSHRLVTTVVSTLIFATAIFSWLRYRTLKWVFRPAILAVALLGLQIVLGGITVLLELPPAIVGIHLGNALILFASLIIAMMYAFRPETASLIGKAWKEKLPRLAVASTIGTFILIISGTVVTGTSAHYACTTWPLCEDQLIPTGGTLAIIAATHRYVASIIGLLILYTLIETWRTKRHVSSVFNASIITLVLMVAQIVVGALFVQMGFPVWVGILHLAVSAATWASIVIYAILTFQTVEAVNVPWREPVPSKDRRVPASTAIGK